MRSWELKGELDVEPEIEGVLGADPGIKGIFGGDLEIAGVLVGKYGRTAVGSGAFPLWQSHDLYHLSRHCCGQVGLEGLLNATPQ